MAGASDLLPPVIGVLNADISGFQKGMKQAGKDMAETEKKGKSHFKAIGVAAAAGLGVGVAAAVGFAKSSISAFEEVAKETAKMVRLTGESAETMSRLRFAAEETGVSAEQLSKGFIRLSKDVATNNKAFDQYHIATKDASGNQLSTNEILENTAEVFANMPNGIDKTALAVQLFGKSGADLIPLLNKGKDGLAELEAESDKYGLTLSQDNVDAMKKNVLAHREMHAAWKGLQVQLGARLMPIIANVTSWMAKELPVALAFAHTAIVRLTPAFEAVSKAVQKVGPLLIKAITWLLDHKAALLVFAAAVGTVLVAAFVAWATAAGAAAAAQLAALAPIIAVVAAIAALGFGIYELVTHWHTVVVAVEGFISRLPELAAKFWGWIEDAVPKAVAALGNFLEVMGSWIVDTALPWLGEHLAKWALAFVEWVGPMIPPLLVELGKLWLKMAEWLYLTALPAILKKLAEWALAFVEWVGPQIPKLIAELGKLWLKMGDWLYTTALPAILAKLAEWALAFVAWVGPQIPKLIAELGKLLVSLGDWALTTALPAILTKLAEWALAFVSWVADAILALPAKLLDLLTTVTGWIGGAVADLTTKLHEWGDAFISWIPGLVTWLPTHLASIATSIVTWIAGIVSTVADKFVGVAAAIGSGIVGAIKGAWNAVATFWNDHIAGAGFTVPGWIPGLGGKGVHVPSLPTLYTGGTVTESGLAVVGERGAEVVALPKGASVYPNGTMPAGAGGASYIFNSYGITDHRTLAAHQAREMAWTLRTAS